MEKNNIFDKEIRLICDDPKTKDYIIDDLTIVLKDIARCYVCSALLRKAAKQYESEKIEKDKDERIIRRTFGSFDPEFSIQKYEIHEEAMKNMMLDLRILFAASKKDKNTGGALLKILKNYHNLENKMIENIKSVCSAVGIDFIVINSKDHIETSIRDELKKNIFYDAYENGIKKKYCLRATIQDFCREIPDFIDKNYKNENGKIENNLRVCKEFEKYNFHKDDWENGEKYDVRKEIENINNIISKTKYHIKNKNKINPNEIHDAIESFSIILKKFMELSMMNFQYSGIRRRNVVGLTKYINTISEIYGNKLTSKEKEKIINAIKEKLPNALELAMMND